MQIFLFIVNIICHYTVCVVKPRNLILKSETSHSWMFVFHFSFTLE